MQSALTCKRFYRQQAPVNLSDHLLDSMARMGESFRLPTLAASHLALGGNLRNSLESNGVTNKHSSGQTAASRMPVQSPTHRTSANDQLLPGQVAEQSNPATPAARVRRNQTRRPRKRGFADGFKSFYRQIAAAQWGAAEHEEKVNARRLDQENPELDRFRPEHKLFGTFRRLPGGVRPE